MGSIRGFNKRYLYIIVILLISVFYIVYEPFKSFSSGVIMLFTSKSSESIIGFLNSYDTVRPAVSIGLMLLQGIIFPFKYEIMIFANIKVFGKLVGLCLSLIGRTMGAYICYDIGRTFLSNRIDLLIEKLNIGDKTIINNMRSNYLMHIFVRVLPANFDLISYAAGILQLDSKKHMLNSIILIIFTTVPYSLKKGYFSFRYEMGATFVRLILSIVVLSIVAKRYHKGIRGFK